MDENQQKTDWNVSQNGRVSLEPSPEEQEWTNKGNQAAQEEQYEVAADAFRHAVALNPNNARSRYNLALAQQLQEETEAAIAGYRRAIDLDPQLIDAYMNLGNLYGELGMQEEALETFQQALEYDPDNHELYVYVGNAYAEQYLYPDAIQAYRQALILNPNSGVAADSLHDVRERVNYQIRRIMDQERHIDENPGDTTCYAELVNLHLDMHNYDSAISAANQILGLDPEERMGYDSLALIYEAMGERDQAAETYEHIVEIAPDDAEAWEHLGSWRSLQSNGQGAITAYARSVQLEPTRYTARFSLAEAYLEEELYEEARQVYQSLIEDGNDLDPDDLAAAYVGLADTLNSMGRYEEAIATSTTLLEKFEDDPEGYYQIATAYDAQGKFDEAVANYRKAIASDPLNAEYYNDLADTLREGKHYDEAQENAQQAIAMDPSLVLAYETLIQIYQETGRNEEAAATQEQVNSLKMLQK